MNNGDMPANPITNHELAISINNGGSSFGGLTKREMMAMHAMQGLLSSDSSSIAFYRDSSDAQSLAQSAVAFADALLKELEK